ncbi:MAG: M28 family peptidase [Bacteroidales bacterium]|jgi:hypothetical protein|nr:M28 family peptidase [Bacteroidales bacterium]
MRKSVCWLILLTLLISFSFQTYSQKIPSGADAITSADLESYVSFLASPLLEGRMNGEPGLEIAQQYIASQARLIGLKPAAGLSYFQPYSMIKKSIDTEKSIMSIIPGTNDTIITKQPVYQIIHDKKLIIPESSVSERITLYNVAAIVEGSDPVLKNEYVIISAHVDHIGRSGGRINAGADDDASGCAALLSIAEAFQSLEKKPLRSILFLWVSGEEIGLYGSRYYVNNPLVPLENTIADLNMDMIGRVKGVADSTDKTPMTGPAGVFVITDNQSRELTAIADEVDQGTLLDFDYSLSGKNHPLQLFARSDHYNFVTKDIPVLFFTTGLHSDYHTPGDVIEKIDFNKLEIVTKTMFRIGYNIANRKTRIVVDNPFSKW